MSQSKIELSASKMSLVLLIPQGKWSKVKAKLTCDEPEPLCTAQERNTLFPIQGDGQWSCELNKKSKKLSCKVQCNSLEVSKEKEKI